MPQFHPQHARCELNFLSTAVNSSMGPDKTLKAGTEEDLFPGEKLLNKVEKKVWVKS